MANEFTEATLLAALRLRHTEAGNGGAGKSEAARAVCDTFTVVAPRGIVRNDELPPGWGLMEATAHVGIVGQVVTLRRTTKPMLLHPDQTGWERETLKRGLVVCMLRAAGAVPGMTSHRERGMKAPEPAKH